MLRTSFFLLCAVFLTEVLPAQNVLLQQPVQQRFGVDTTVVVPDRGSAILGGVSQSRQSRNSYGPWRSGSTIEGEVSNSSLSTSVYIHDFEAMDRWLLNEGQRRFSSNSTLLSRDPRVLFLLSRDEKSASKPMVTPRNKDAERQKALVILKGRR